MAQRPPDKRKDAPPVNYAIRGDKRRGLEIARTPELLDPAIEQYRADIRSSGDTTDAFVKTWSGFHDQVRWTRLGLPEPCPVIPLTPKNIKAVGAVLKAAHYRSTKNYINA